MKDILLTILITPATSRAEFRLTAVKPGANLNFETSELIKRRVEKHL